MNGKEMKIYKILLFVSMLICLIFQVDAQTGNQLIKKLPNGSEVYLSEFSIVEFRSRPREANENVPENEIFENQEWNLKRFILTLRSPQSGQEEKLCEYKIDVNVNSKYKYFTGGFSLKDFSVNDRNAYILYMSSSNLYVDHLTKGKNLGWYVNSTAELATSYGFQPILEAKFAVNKPEITARYYTDNQRYGLWKWKLKGNKWILKSNKLIKDDDSDN